MNARTSILAAANPRDSRFNENLPILQNVNLPPTLVSRYTEDFIFRFDLLYLVLDKFNEAEDRKLAKHLASLYLQDNPDGGRTNSDVIEFIVFFHIFYTRILKQLESI